MKRINSLYNVLILILILFLFGCSVEKNRNLLEVFFDGVPGKSIRQIPKKNKVGVIKTKEKSTVQIVSIHPDYKSKNCSKCHAKGVSSFLKTDTKEICFNCHKRESFTARYIHGPVAVKACNTCHLPHRSGNRKLLRQKGRELCDQCHTLPVTNGPIPCKGVDCIKCHDPHVSSNQYLLKERLIDPHGN